MSLVISRVAAAFLAVGLVFATVAPAEANLPLNQQLVLDAIDQRVMDLDDDINDLIADLSNQTPAMRIQTRRQIRQLQVRIRQLQSLRRVVPRFNQTRLEQIDAYFTLNVSFH